MTDTGASPGTPVGTAAAREAPTPPHGGDGKKSLGTQTIQGLFWAYGSYVFGRVLVLVSISILARLLAPRDFGLVALALTFTALLETVKDVGLGQALVLGKDDDTADRANTVFFWGMVIGCAGAGVIMLASPLIADFYREPALVPLLIVLALNFPLRALGSTHYALAQKGMDFRTRTLAELTNVSLRGAAGVVLALLGFGAWSLVLGYLVGTVALTAVLWLKVPWRPSWRASTAHGRELFKFGGAFTGVDVLHAISASADALVIGRVLGAADLGLYALGLRLPELLVINIAVVAGTVLFPAFTKVGAARIGDAFLISLRYTVMIGLPLAVGLTILAEPTILALFGDQWGGSVSPMQVLTIYGFAVTLGLPAGTAYKATGRAGILLKLAVPRATLIIITIVLFAEQGITVVAACLASVTGLFALIGISIAPRLIGVRWRDMWRQVAPTLVAVAAMAAVMLVVESRIASPWPAVLTGAASGAVVYVAALFIVARDAMRYLLRKVSPGSAA